MNEEKLTIKGIELISFFNFSWSVLLKMKLLPDINRTLMLFLFAMAFLNELNEAFPEAVLALLITEE
jgi:hypothetical protein